MAVERDCDAPLLHLVKFCASEIITENLVDFASVSQLQQQRTKNFWGVSVEFRPSMKFWKRKGVTPELKAQLEAALRELDEMHEARRRQAQMVETIIKTKTSSPDSAAANASTKSSITETLTIELEQLKKHLESKQRDTQKTIYDLEIVKKDLVDEKVSRLV